MKNNFGEREEGGKIGNNRFDVAVEAVVMKLLVHAG